MNFPYIVLSMPAPTPPDRVLAAAKVFARENFGLKHRYTMALHTHQQHLHVHLVVKAEGLEGRRLHIDKAMLQDLQARYDAAVSLGKLKDAVVTRLSKRPSESWQELEQLLTDNLPTP